MKNRAAMLLILAFPLLLASCGGGGESSSTVSSNSNSETSQSSGDISQSSDSNESVSISSSTSLTSIDYSIGWNQDILDVMTPHLGGHAIPFIDLPGQVIAQWVEASSYYDYSAGGYITTPAYLGIFSNGAFDDSLAWNTKLRYQQAGWNVEFDRTTRKMHAEEPSLGIKVDFYGVYDENDGMTNPQVDVFYNEPFIVPTNWSWRNSTLEVLENINVVAPHALPYVYLGTLAEEVVIPTSGSYIEIQGLFDGWTSYSSEILAAVRSGLAKSKKWSETEVTISVPSYYSTTTASGYSFRKTFSDGYTVTAILYARHQNTDSYSASDMTPYLRVTCIHS